MTWEVVVYGCLLRFVQAALAASPTILIGLLVAGVIRRLLGYERTLRLFGGNSWRSLPQSWLMGMLLPVCSLGVIPILYELRRAGLKGGAILAFAVAAPLFNPLSFLYGLTLSQPLVIVAFAMCSLVTVTGVGIYFDRVFSDTALPTAHLSPSRFGWPRMLAVGLVGTRHLASATGLYLLLGLLGTSLLAACIPAGSLQLALGHENKLAPVIAAAVGVPAYATPMGAITQVGSMFQHGNSVGAALVVLSLGAGLNVGLIFWCVCNYGLRRTVCWLAAVVAVVLAEAYTIESPLYPRDAEPADHTHAFDIYCNPFRMGSRSIPASAWLTFNSELRLHEVLSLAALGLVLVAGVVGRIRNPAESWELALERENDTLDTSAPWWNRPLPNPVLGGVILVGLILFSAVGCYTYYPAPDEMLKEMNIVRTETLAAALGGRANAAEDWIEVWDDSTRRLQVGLFLRTGKVSRYQRIKARLLRDRLEFLEHAVHDGQQRQIRETVADVERAFRRLRDAFRTSSLDQVAIRS